MATVEINDGDYILKVPERTVNAYLNRLNKLLAMPGGVRIAKAYLAAVKLCSPMVYPPLRGGLTCRALAGKTNAS